MNYTVKYDFDRDHHFGKIHFDDRMVLPQEYNLQDQLKILREKIKAKYNYEI